MLWEWENGLVRISGLTNCHPRRLNLSKAGHRKVGTTNGAFFGGTAFFFFCFGDCFGTPPKAQGHHVFFLVFFWGLEVVFVNDFC